MIESTAIPYETFCFFLGGGTGSVAPITFSSSKPNKEIQQFIMMSNKSQYQSLKI